VGRAGGECASWREPYPNLLDEWNPAARQWSWQVASLDEVPEVERAIEIAEHYHSSTGTLTSAESPENAGRDGPAWPAPDTPPACRSRRR
jgi:hypothetical protein